MNTFKEYLNKHKSHKEEAKTSFYENLRNDPKEAFKESLYLLNIPYLKKM